MNGERSEEAIWFIGLLEGKLNALGYTTGDHIGPMPYHAAFILTLPGRSAKRLKITVEDAP